MLQEAACDAGVRRKSQESLDGAGDVEVLSYLREAVAADNASNGNILLLSTSRQDSVQQTADGLICQ